MIEDPKRPRSLSLSTEERKTVRDAAAAAGKKTSEYVLDLVAADDPDRQRKHRGEPDRCLPLPVLRRARAGRGLGVAVYGEYALPVEPEGEAALETGMEPYAASEAAMPFRSHVPMLDGEQVPGWIVPVVPPRAGAGHVPELPPIGRICAGAVCTR